MNVMNDRELGVQVENLAQDDELTQAKFIELAMQTECYSSMCDVYESEISPEEENTTDPPFIFYHGQHGWAWAWGGDAGRLSELGSGSMGSAKLSSGYDLE